MLLPDPKHFAKLCGATSVGEVLLGPELRCPGGNHTVHRNLRAVLAGKSISRSAFVEILEAVTKNFARESGTLRKPEVPDCRTNKMERDLESYEVTLAFWQGIANAFPERFAPLKTLIERLLNPSHNLWKIHKNEGDTALAEKLRMVESGSVGSFFEAVATELELGQNDDARPIEALQSFGLFTIVFAYIALFEKDDPEKMLAQWKLVFCEVDGRVHPEQAFSSWLLRIKDKSGHKTNSEFLEVAYGAPGVRDGKKYLAGQVVPPYKNSRQMLATLNLATDEDEWLGLQLGLIVVTLVARASKALKPTQHGKVDLRPHQVVYDHLVALLNERTTKQS
ncbi:hypothetical protein [Shimia sediminis]|uniref:hypothetical protein n=1 Tax=Shimia sediminis TaxID=2497945 RepID=UPI000F8D720F|nr:hypothetical protein [Shimia sediminis]